MDKILDEQLDIMARWISTRDLVRRRRIKNLPPPWTDDLIIANYRFCNVRRMDDKVSKWLLNWHVSHCPEVISIPRVAVACVAGRLINWPNSLVELSYPVPYVESEWTGKLLARKNRGEKVFTGAYIINGALGGDKILQVTQKILAPMWGQRRLIPKDGSSMEAVWNALNGQPGIGSFMAGQAVADLRHVAPDFDWSDRHTWAPQGPGSKRGVNRMIGRPIQTTLPRSEWLDIMRRAYTTTAARLPIIFSRLELMDFQNCLCEYDKYCRLTLGEGTVRSRYIPGRIQP